MMKPLTSAVIATNFVIPKEARAHRYILIGDCFRMEIKPQGVLSLRQNCWQTIPDNKLKNVSRDNHQARQCLVREFINSTIASLREAASQTPTS